MKTIQATLFVGDSEAEVLGQYTNYDLAVEDAKNALAEVSPEDSKITVRPSKNGKVKNLDPQSVQIVTATNSEYCVKLTIQVTADELGDEPSLVEGPVFVSEAPDEVVSVTELPMFDPSAEVPIPGPNFVQFKPPAKKTKAQKYPDPIVVGEHKWWGCDQHTVLSWVETHPDVVTDNSIELRKRGGKFALVCDKTTIWTCRYEEVAQYATQVANTKALEVTAKAA